MALYCGIGLYSSVTKCIYIRAHLNASASCLFFSVVHFLLDCISLLLLRCFGTARNPYIFFILFIPTTQSHTACMQVYEPLQSKKQAQRQSASSPSPVRRPSSDTTNNNDHDNTNDADGGGDTSMTSRFAYYLGLRSASSANNNSNNSASSTANQKKKKKTVLHTRYLYGLFAILFVYVLYLGAGVNGRLGKVFAIRRVDLE